MLKCPYYYGDYRLFCSTGRKTKVKSLLIGCCGLYYVRSCPKPSELLRSPRLGRSPSPHLTADEKDFLGRLQNLDWFSNPQVALILQIEAEIAARAEVAA